VLGHADGVCHIFIDRAAGPEMTSRIVVDGKTQYLVVCTAVETVLIHAAVAAAMLPSLVHAMEEKSVKIRGRDRTLSLPPGLQSTTCRTRSGTPNIPIFVLAIRIVTSLDDALAHIDQYGSYHADAIIT
jgi:glutamate-5-semialdehyde dehydrogenase